MPHVVNLSKAIVENYPDISLHIVTNTPNTHKSFSIQKGGINYHICKTQYRLPFGKHWPLFEWNIFTRLRFQRASLCKVARQVNPDVIHAFGTELAYAVAAKDSGKPYIIYIQGIIQELTKVFPQDRKFAIRVPLEKEAFEDCRYYIAETEFAASYVQKTVQDPIIWRVGNSVTELFFRVRKKLKVYNRLLFIGTVIPTKGIEEMLAAADENGWPVTIVGPHWNKKYLQMLMEKYQHNSDIRWRGTIPTEEIARLMRVHDALVLPSYMDTSPYVVAEAMAAGLPVVATRVGGIPDMVLDGVTGILVEPKSVASLSNGIGKLYTDSEKLFAMGSAARQVAIKQYSPKRNADIIVGAYKKIIK
jgi:glycosyltransferase involved in cell wall biosynthesis